MTKVVVIGLDGATWDLLKPWADNGELPAIKKLMDNGVWGILESTIPPVTGPAWTSFSTGKNPGKHGIFDFVKLENNTLKLHQSRDIGSETIYDLLSRNNLRSVVIGLPLSFPPKDGFNGVMISDFLYAGKDIIPKSKNAYITHYRVYPNILLNEEEFLEDMITTTKSQVDVAKKLYVKENWDFYFFYFFAIDSVGHHFWKDIQGNTRMGQKAKKAFRIADRFIRWVSNEMDRETILFLMSDHGFADCPFKINLNHIFLEKGLLRTQRKEGSDDHMVLKHVARTFDKSNKRPSIIRKSMNGLAIKPLIELITKKKFQTVVSGVEKIGIDFENSNAFVATSESMSVHVRENEIKKYKEIVKEIVETLRELEYRGQRVFKDVLLKDEVYSGPFTESAPDILLIPNGFQISSRLGDEIYSAFNTGGWHDLGGIFLAFGSNIRASSAELKNLKIYDIMPTILHILGLPIPNDMDGRVLTDIFNKESEFAIREIIYQEDKAKYEKWRIKRKLEQLRNI